MNETLLPQKDPNSLPQIDPTKDYWAELAGPGGKFHREDEAEAKRAIAKAKAESDLYIKSLEQRLDESRQDYLTLHEQYKAAPKLEELVAKLERQRLASNDEPPVNEDSNKEPAFKPEDLERLLDTKLSEREAQRTQTENLRMVKAKLAERYGEKSAEVLQTQMDRLGLSPEFADQLARTNPKVFMKTFDLDEPAAKEDFQAPPRNNQRPDPFAPKGGEKRTWTYYQNLRKTDPVKYRDPATHVQMHKDYLALGKDFEDGNFNQ